MKAIVSLFLWLFAFSFAAAQHHLTPSLYIRDMNFFNPSSVPVDSSGRHYASVLAKRKWVDNDDAIWNKPASFLFNYMGRIRGARSLFTVGYLSDRYSFFSRNGIYGGYIQQIALGRKTGLSFGGRAVLNADLVHWSRLKIPVTENGRSLKFSPDLDLGMEFRSGGFTLGAAAHNILEGSIKADDSELIRNRRAFLFHSAYLFGIGKSVKVSPYVLVRLKRNVLFDAGLYTSLFNRINLSYTFRINELRGIYAAEVRIAGRLFAGIAYDRSVLYSDHNGDLALRYQF